MVRLGQAWTITRRGNPVGDLFSVFGYKSGVTFSREKALELGLIQDARGQWIQPKRQSHVELVTLSVPVDRESDLHRQVQDWLDAHGWVYIHSRMDRKSTTSEGSPDFVIGCPNGRTLWLELKSRRGKIRPEQRYWEVQLRRLGHIHSFIRCMNDFLQISESMAK